VQRIVREFAEVHEADILLVKFDPKNGVYRIVPRISLLRYRPTTGWRGRTRLRLKRLYWSLTREFSQQGNKKRFVPKFVQVFARYIFDTFLSDSHLEREGGLQRRPQWHAQAHQTFLLLDIPVHPSHVEALTVLAEAGEVRLVAYVHDLMPLSPKHLFDNRYHPGVRARHLRYLDAVGSAEVVVCNSEFTRRQYLTFVDLLEGSPVQDVRVVYPPWPAFAKTDADAIPAEKTAFNDATIGILVVGALDTRKNLRVLVEAMHILIARKTDARLVIVAGAGAAKDPHLLSALSNLPEAERDRVVILRAITDELLVSLYDAATLVAVPSLAEGFGLPVVEAISRGKPVVAADATAIPELAKILPVELVAPMDAEAWADAIVTVASRGGLRPVSRPPEFPQDWVDFRARVVGV